MLEEHDLVVLLADVPGEDDLKAGDVGTIVHIHPERAAFTVEFMTFDGNTVAVVTVPASQVRPVTGEDLTHARRVRIAV